jgi:hypothetical protein
MSTAPPLPKAAVLTVKVVLVNTWLPISVRYTAPPCWCAMLSIKEQRSTCRLFSITVNTAPP